MWGISEAFEIAEPKTLEIWQPWLISIFSDSQTILNHLKECHSAKSQVLEMQIDQKAGSARARNFCMMGTRP